MRKPHSPIPDARRRAVTLAVPSLLAGLLAPRGALAQYSSSSAPRLDVPYVPTPQPVVDKMLEVGKVGKNDVLYDLGCGDGRIVVTAVKDRGASRGVGIDIDPQRISEARENAKKAGVGDKVEFRNADLFESDFSPATVVTLYLLPSINQKLRPQLWKQLKVGTRVVSHDFDMGEAWPPERTERVANKTIYYWTIKPEHKKA
ncbi:SAM-dependent methyltransferase [Ramlibacter tataouinensis]|uniref:Methyltransferase domain-containing protein n=1 Tax=Ramlibacter tataouinensis (strain ATCC BAA-407 / DSM 14655 / LMG 21543 / TTB310) TaxID=365046 RepID=F5XY71_RAMTT|nr:class I SAM-dependent methyltransferase [Ramlibacter tataouinensis]AEG91864.1 Conserved hypothetical protein [Ramlibacter tataouinensis TTB310]